MITAMGQAKRILIADDEPGVIMILAMRLRANGYDVIAAHNGMQAIELANREKPDLIVLDIRMPDKDGYAVFEELRASANTRSTPVVFFSALPPEQAEEKAAQLGADGFVSKSADPEEVVATIRGILTRLENKIELTGIRK